MLNIHINPDLGNYLYSIIPKLSALSTISFYSLCKLLQNSISLRDEGEFYIDETLPSQFISIEINIIKIQRYYRMHMEIMYKKYTFNNMELILRKGIRIEDIYQIINVEIDTVSRNRIEITSNKAKNRVEIQPNLLFKQELWEHIKNDLNKVKKIIGVNLLKLVTYDKNSSELIVKIINSD